MNKMTDQEIFEKVADFFSKINWAKTALVIGILLMATSAIIFGTVGIFGPGDQGRLVTACVFWGFVGMALTFVGSEL